MIQFDAGQHKYVRNNKNFVSVTTLLHKYQKPFNREYWSLYKALQAKLGFTNSPEDKRKFRGFLNKASPNFENENMAQLKQVIAMKAIDLGTKQNEIKAEWTQNNRTACDKGTEIHNFMENKDIAEKSGSISTKTAQLISTPKYEDLEVGYYSELRLFLDEYNLAGTADKVLIYEHKGKKYFYIGDYKTNKELTFENKYQNLLGPLSHLQDTKFNIYALQMSIYSYMLEKQFGIRYGHSELIHYQDYDINKKKIYATPYLKKEVIALLKHYKRQLTTNNKKDGSKEKEKRI